MLFPKLTVAQPAAANVIARCCNPCLLPSLRSVCLNFVTSPCLLALPLACPVVFLVSAPLLRPSAWSHSHRRRPRPSNPPGLPQPIGTL